jgi:hypothetical protein
MQFATWTGLEPVPPKGIDSLACKEQDQILVNRSNHFATTPVKYWLC